MTGSTFFVSRAAVHNLKHRAQRDIQGVGSGHMSEAVAACLGFKTHAALMEALRGRTTVEVSRPSNARLFRRLADLGHTGFSAGAEVVPEFDRSYTLFRRFPLRRKTGVRWSAWRNLIVTAINTGLERRLFGLEPADNWWPGGHRESQLCKAATYEFEVEGTRVLASVDCHPGDELSINVVANPKRHVTQADFLSGFREGDAAATCFFERYYGAWMHDGGEGFRCRVPLLTKFAALQVQPVGYGDLGSSTF